MVETVQGAILTLKLLIISQAVSYQVQQTRFTFGLAKKKSTKIVTKLQDINELTLFCPVSPDLKLSFIKIAHCITYK